MEGPLTHYWSVDFTYLCIWPNCIEMSSNVHSLRSRDPNVKHPVQAFKQSADAEKKNRSSVPVVKSNAEVKRPPKPTPVKLDPRFNFDQKYLQHPTAFSVFAPDVFAYMKQQETRYQVSDYLTGNSVMGERHRALVVDWLVECQEEYCFQHETLYISIRLFDVYMSQNLSTSTHFLQLVAACSFLIASKYEEYVAIGIKELKGVCLHTYDVNEIRAMEIEVLRASRCDLGFPLAYAFLRRYARVVGTDLKTLTLARFYLEISVYYFQLALESPSKMATSVLVLALSESNSNLDWEPVLEHYSGYSIQSLAGGIEQVGTAIARFKTNFPKCTAVISKYSDESFYNIAAEFLP